MARSRSANVQPLAPAGSRCHDVGTVQCTPLDQGEAGPAVFADHARNVLRGERRPSVARDNGDRERQQTAGSRQTADRIEHGSVLRERAAQKRSPWEVDRQLIRERIEGEALQRLAEQDEVRDRFADSTTRRIGEGISGCIESDRERVRPRSGHVERVPSVARSRVDHRAREATGELGQLTDVDIEEALADELSHATDVTGGARRSGLPCGVHRLVRVLNEALRAADGAWDVEAMVEIAKILRSFERFLERGFGQAQRGAQPLELTLIDFSRCHGCEC